MNNSNKTHGILIIHTLIKHLVNTYTHIYTQLYCLCLLVRAFHSITKLWNMNCSINVLIDEYWISQVCSSVSLT